LLLGTLQGATGDITIQIAVRDQREVALPAYVDVDFSAADYSFCLGRDRHTTFRTVLVAIGAVLTAAIIAAVVTFVTEWMRTGYARHAPVEAIPIASSEEPGRIFESTLTSANGPFGFKPVRESEVANTIVAMSGASVLLLDSPFASGNQLLFLSAPVGSEALREGQTSGSSANLVAGTLLAGGDSPDRLKVKIPLPRLRPYQDRQPQNAGARPDNVANIPDNSADPAPNALSSSLSFLRKLLHFGQAGNNPKLPPEADGRTAVYDIEGHVVYLPNGEKLEAHSGLGNGLDNPRYVTEKSRGPTPPNIYRLALRTPLFHGIQAIRLNPVSVDKMYGRAGMLVHPYMLGANGQSNGCISLQDYRKFLQAFLRGDVDRVIVVTRLEDTSFRTASAFVGE
jgi:hypothetical protein